MPGSRAEVEEQCGLRGGARGGLGAQPRPGLGRTTICRCDPRVTAPGATPSADGPRAGAGPHPEAAPGPKQCAEQPRLRQEATGQAAGCREL